MGEADFRDQAVLLCKWQEQLVRAFLEAGVELHIVLDDYDASHDAADVDVLAAAASCYTVRDFDSLESLATVAADLLIRGVKIDRIVSHAEFSQFGAAYLGSLLGVNASKALSQAATRDKRLMKTFATRGGVPAARFMSLRSSADEKAANDIAGQLTFPVVVKPAAGMGTLSTIRVERPEDLIEALRRFELAPYLKSYQLTVEEFVTGRELHVDALWSDQRAVYFVISAYYETRLALSLPEAHTPATRDGSYVVHPDDEPEFYLRVRKFHELVNTAFAISDGPTHLEIFERADGTLVFSEIATRIGGAWIPGVLSSVLDRDVWGIVAEALIGRPVPAVRPSKKYLGGFIFKPAGPGVIDTMPTEAAALACPGVQHWDAIRKCGDEVFDDPNSRWSAFVVIGGETLADYEEAVERAHRCLEIRTVRGVAVPAPGQDS